jgi:hypothetical protein
MALASPGAVPWPVVALLASSVAAKVPVAVGLLERFALPVVIGSY